VGRIVIPGIPEPVVSRMRATVMAVAVLVVVSTLGYVVFADYPLFDALYMTVITLGTIGYGEVHPLDTAGRVWTMVVVVGGFAVFVTSAATLSELFLSADLGPALRERRGRRMRAQLHEHVIVVGFGRVGRPAVDALGRQGVPCLVIDRLDGRVAEAGAIGVTTLDGDAMDEDVLREAGVERASALVAAADDDQTNLVVVITARALAPELRIVTRVNDPTWTARFLRAGADVALSPYDSFGSSLAASALTDVAIDQHDLASAGLRTEELVVTEGSALDGADLDAVRVGHPGIVAVGLRDDDGDWSEVQGQLRSGDVLVVHGAPRSLEELVAELRRR
jgi:voltage-gated potassium channel